MTWPDAYGKPAMESPENAVTVETLCDYIKALDGDQRVFRKVNNNALLVPVEAPPLPNNT